MIDATVSWVEENQRALVEWLAAIRDALERHGEAGRNGRTSSTVDRHGEAAALPATLAHLVAVFGLSSFERDIVLLCAGMELDSRFAGACAKAQGDSAMPYPTFGLALAAFDDAHWSALSPMAPLRRRGLIVLCGDSVSTSPLRIDERILHELTGVRTIDARLAPYLDERPAVSNHTASHDEIAAEIVRRLAAGDPSSSPKVLLCGADPELSRAAAAAACRACGLAVLAVAAHQLPANAVDLYAIVGLLEREALLTGALLLIEDDGSMESTARERVFSRFAGVAPPVLCVARDRGGVVDGFVIIDAPLRPIGESAASRASRERARSRLGALAQRVETNVEWADLILPTRQLGILR
jgi:hypothetical protein